MWSSPIGWVTEMTRMPSRSRSELLVAACLDLVACEPRGVVDEHHIELAGGGVGHQALELGAGL